MRLRGIGHLFVLAVAVLVLVGGWAGQAAAEKRVALVIGNSAYANAPALKNPRNDAEDFALAMRRLGFDVIAGYDLDQKAMGEKVRDFARALETADVALFFYAGHGLQSNGQNYLVPVSATLQKESDLDFETVSLDLVMKQMQRSARVSLVFLDACRDNPLTRSLRGGSRSTAVGQGLARISDAAGTLIAFSTQPGNVALDGSGRNSPFTKALLENLEKPNTTIGDVMIDVRRSVMAATGERQVPWENSALTGKFYFRPPAEGAVADAPAPPPGEQIGVSAAALDHTFWISIANSNDATLYREYLRRFPGGTYASIADAKLQTLTAAQQPAVANDKVALATGSTGEAQRSIESPRQLAQDLQRELKRVGCYSGGISGSWTQNSRRAMTRFNDAVKLELPADAPSRQSIDKVKSFSGAVCEPQPTQAQREPQKPRHAPSSGGGAGDAAVGGFVGGLVGGYIGSKLRR